MEKEHIRKLLDNINEEKKELKEREVHLNKLTTELWKQLSREFECPLGLSNYTALCSECEYVLPEFTLGSAVGTKKGFQRFSLWFPHNYDEKKRERFILKAGTDGCREWRKKEKSATCGCGGNWSCKCGYYEEFCMSLNDTKECPFCGRSLYTETGIYKEVIK